MDAIDVKALNLNESPLTDKDVEAYRTDKKTKHWQRSPFSINEDINRRVVLYDGAIELLSAEAIVNPTNENLNHLSYVSNLAGQELEKYIRKKVRYCATGDVRLTPGFDSNFKHVIHAVPPKYQPKYKTAAETALFNTYFRVFGLMIEKKIRTVVLPTLTTSKCDMPIEDNCQLQMRILRRILEKKRHEFDRIVLHVQNINRACAEIFFCFFPRTPIDEEIACYRFDSGSLGGANGEPVIPEREIRIKSTPSFGDVNDNSIDLTSGLDLSTVVGKTAFSRMRDDFDLPAKEQQPMRRKSSNNQIAIRKPVIKGCILL